MFAAMTPVCNGRESIGVTAIVPSAVVTYGPPMSEHWFELIVTALCLFTAGHMIGWHRGWMNGYWTEHPRKDATDE